MAESIKENIISWLNTTKTINFYKESSKESEFLRLDSLGIPHFVTHGHRRSASIRDNVGANTPIEYRCNIYNSFISSLIGLLEIRFGNDRFCTALKWK